MFSANCRTHVECKNMIEQNEGFYQALLNHKLDSEMQTVVIAKRTVKTNNTQNIQ